MKTKLLVGLMSLVTMSALGGEPGRPKFAVKIQDDKAVVVESDGSGAVDPTQRIRLQSVGNLQIQINTMQGQILQLSHFPSFLINGRFMNPALMGGRFKPMPLAKTPNGKVRIGFTSTWNAPDGLNITQILEVAAAKAKKRGDKRLMNTVMITYVIENKGTQKQTIGVRTYMDTYVIDNDGCQFAAPTIPDKVLDGRVLEGKTLPPYLQMLQRPDLKNPGFVSHLTLEVGSRFEKPKKIVLTRHGFGFNNWDMPAVASMGDSAIGVYWDAKEVKAGDKREIRYAYGEGIAVPADSEGRFELALGGSFEPGKAFTISAAVADPAVGQSLALELPPGMERLDGKEIQPVAPLADGQELSTVLWKARVLKTGDYTLRIRSSTGITQAKRISIAPAPREKTPVVGPR